MRHFDFLTLAKVWWNRQHEKLAKNTFILREESDKLDDTRIFFLIAKFFGTSPREVMYEWDSDLLEDAVTYIAESAKGG